MKVTNNRAKSATVFYKANGKMKKVKLKPFESLAITELVDINAVKNNMVISNFTTIPASMTGTTFNIVNPYNDGRSVSATKKIGTTRQTKGRFGVDYN